MENTLKDINCLPLFAANINQRKQDDTGVFLNLSVSDDWRKKLSRYDLNTYIKDIQSQGLSQTWDDICAYILKFGENTEFLRIADFGELYEIGLDIQNKIQKKESGQYFTPDDVAYVMSKWFDSCTGENICDVGCGTGQLILTYLNHIGKERANKLIKDGRLFLYDSDETALKICKTSLIIKYDIKNHDCIHAICTDFLDADIALPEKAKVIANPPYAAIKYFGANWQTTDVLLDSKELYAAFAEKIIKQAEAAVIITPFSFISADKYYSLRKKISDSGNGFIVAFDNVPGNIFCGRKHGIFNTNTANSVRAAITVFHKDDALKGFQISPLIRFKTDERKKLLVNEVLENTLPENRQIINKNNPAFKKIDKSLFSLYEMWQNKSLYKLQDVISTGRTDFFINMPNTCRYFTTAAHRPLKRTGLITLYAKDKKAFDFLYCFINSSFAYWWWRIFDGGITYPKSLLKNMPLPLNLLSKEDELFFEKMCKEMIRVEADYIVTKLNAGVAQENIKFPPKYCEQINNRLLSVLGYKADSEIFAPVHSNNFFGEIKP